MKERSPNQTVRDDRGVRDERLVVAKLALASRRSKPPATGSIGAILARVKDPGPLKRAGGFMLRVTSKLFAVVTHKGP